MALERAGRLGEWAAADDDGFGAVGDAKGDGLGEGFREGRWRGGNGWGDAGAAIEMGEAEVVGAGVDGGDEGRGDGGDGKAAVGGGGVLHAGLGEADDGAWNGLAEAGVAGVTEGGDEDAGVGWREGAADFDDLGLGGGQFGWGDDHGRAADGGGADDDGTFAGAGLGDGDHHGGGSGGAVGVDQQDAVHGGWTIGVGEGDNGWRFAYPPMTVAKGYRVESFLLLFYKKEALPLPTFPLPFPSQFVSYIHMSATPIPPNISATLPDLARRLAMILGPLAALVVAEFLRRPKLAGLILVLWRRLTHVARRFAQVKAATATRRPARARVARETRPAVVRLPSGRGWLVQSLGYQAANYASQLEHLLAQPEMRAAIDAAPGFGRVLRPVCWMLGIARARATATAQLVATGDGAVARPVEDPAWPPVARLMSPVVPWMMPVFKTRY